MPPDMQIVVIDDAVCTMRGAEDGKSSVEAPEAKLFEICQLK